MARIAGVNLPAQKHVWVGLQSIYGIGRTRSKQVCEAAGVTSSTKIRDLSEPDVERLFPGDFAEGRRDELVAPRPAQGDERQPPRPSGRKQGECEVSSECAHGCNLPARG